MLFVKTNCFGFIAFSRESVWDQSDEINRET